MQNFINSAKFADNGGCGYVLKPEILRNPSNPYASHGLDQLEGKSPWKLRIKVLSGHFLNTLGGSHGYHEPFVKVSIKGHPIDKKSLETKSVKSCGIHSLWNPGDISNVPTFEFEIKIPSLAFLEIKVKSNLIKKSKHVDKVKSLTHKAKGLVKDEFNQDFEEFSRVTKNAKGKLKEEFHQDLEELSKAKKRIKGKSKEELSQEAPELPEEFSRITRNAKDKRLSQDKEDLSKEKGKREKLKDELSYVKEKTKEKAKEKTKTTRDLALFCCPVMMIENKGKK